MLKSRKIAITGGIASGKTTVCRILKDHGASILNSDEIIHMLLREDPICIQKVKDLLGPSVESVKGIDRGKVADIVFNDVKKLQALEALLHPILLKKIEEEFGKGEKANGGGYFVVELPLVQEIGREKDFDLIVVVISDKEKALKRFIKAGFSKETFQRRNARLWNQEKKVQSADYVIRNDGTLEELKHQVVEMMKEKLF